MYTNPIIYNVHTLLKLGHLGVLLGIGTSNIDIGLPLQLSNVNVLPNP